MKFKLKRLDNRGVVYVWVTVLVSIVVIFFTYIIFDDVVRNELYNMALEMGVDSGSLNTLITLWNIFPFAFVIGLFFFGIIWSAKREFDTGYY